MKSGLKLLVFRVKQRTYVKDDSCLPWQHMLSPNAQKKIRNKKERELPKNGKTYGYPPSMRHGSTLPTPTWPMTSACFLSTEEKAEKAEHESKLWRKLKVFYPESSSFPWSLRSAAQSSDRQFFSNQVWGGNSKVHSSYDLMHRTHQLHIQTRGQCCVVVGVDSYPGRPKSLVYLIFLLISQRTVFGFQAKSWKGT